MRPERQEGFSHMTTSKEGRAFQAHRTNKVFAQGDFFRKRGKNVTVMKES